MLNHCVLDIQQSALHTIEQAPTVCFDILGQTDEENAISDRFSSSVLPLHPDMWNPEALLHKMMSMGDLWEDSFLQMSPLTASDCQRFDDPPTSDQAAKSGMILNDQPGVPLEKRASAKGGKVSGVQTLKPVSGSDTSHRRILPGLFFSKATTNSHYLGIYSLISFL